MPVATILYLYWYLLPVCLTVDSRDSIQISKRFPSSTIYGLTLVSLHFFLHAVVLILCKQRNLLYTDTHTYVYIHVC